MEQPAGADARVRRAGADDLGRCLEIIRALPDHFTHDVPDSVRRDLGAHGGWVILAACTVVGFVVVDRRAPRAAEILWIAVDPARRNAGLGSRLLGQALAELRDQGVALVEVKTLDRSADYEPYEATLAFYERNGFVQIDCIEELPGWPPGNPAAIYAAALETTRGPG
ncbi:MAG: GNAT family N-acetyltransferase [Thermoleophilaceae bacterium]|nr:GNAT family N-acetyltransferase [Thermoleophilaceae bacterium]